MAGTATVVSVEEYLQTSYEPACEYSDGVLTQKPMPTRKHARLQGHVYRLIEERCPQFEAATELTVRISPNRFLVPDVAVEWADRTQDPYPTEPIHLCIEILSPGDRLGDILLKADEYLAWGVPFIWILDAENKVAYELHQGRPLHEIPPGGSLTASPIALPLADLFSA